MWEADFLKAGLETDGANLHAWAGNITARNIISPVGNVYYVDQRESTSGNGTSWKHAFTTIEEAISVCRDRVDWSASPWAKNDVIVIGPGSYDENLTALPHGCTLIGSGPDMKDAQLGTKIAPTTGSPVDVGGFVNGMFINIGFHCTYNIAVVYAAFDCEVLNNVTFYNCYFSGPVETSTTPGILANDSVALRVIDCQFSCLDKGIDINYADGGDSFSHAFIKK